MKRTKRLISTCACTLAVLIWTCPPTLARFKGTLQQGQSAAQQDGRGDLSINVTLDDIQVVFAGQMVCDNKKPPHCVEFLVIKLEQVLISSYRTGEEQRRVEIKATAEGEYQQVGGYLYMLAALGGAADPEGSVRALGYDITVREKNGKACTDRFPMEACTEASHRVAMLVDAALGLGNPDVRAQFRDGAARLGFAPDCSMQEPPSSGSRR